MTRAAHQRPRRRSHGGFGGCALRRFQERRVADPRSCPRRCGRCAAISCARRRSMRWRNTAFPRSRRKGALKAAVNLFLPFKQFDHRRVLVHVNLDGATVNRKGSTLAATDLIGGRRYRRCSGGPCRYARPRPGRRVPDDGARAAQSAGDPHAIGLSRHLQRRVRCARRCRCRRAFPSAVRRIGTACSRWRRTRRASARSRITSSLAGLELKLPEPLAKPAGSALPTSVDAAVAAERRNAGARGLGIGAARRLDPGFGCRRTEARSRRRHVRFGRARVQRHTDRQRGRQHRAAGSGRLACSSARPRKSAKPLANYLRSAKLEVARIDYLGLSFLDVALELTENDGGWRIAVGGPNVVGHHFPAGRRRSGRALESRVQAAEFRRRGRRPEVDAAARRP